MLLGFEVFEKINEARWREHELKNHGIKKKLLIKNLEKNIKEIAQMVISGSTPEGRRICQKASETRISKISRRCYG